MFQTIKPGRCLFAVAIIGFGLINFITGHFPPAFVPVPVYSALNTIVVYAVGAFWLIAGICLLFKKFAQTAALLVALVFFVNLLYPQLISAITRWNNPNLWTVTLEMLAMCSGTLLLAASSGKPNKILLDTAAVCRYTFAFTLLGFGLLHFLYAGFIATLIPGWMPARLFLNYTVLFAFVATAISILLNRQVPLSTFLLAIMFLVWVLVLHLPRCFANPHTIAEWSSLLIALMMSSICFVLASRTDKSMIKPQVQ